MFGVRLGPWPEPFQTKMTTIYPTEEADFLALQYVHPNLTSLDVHGSTPKFTALLNPLDISCGLLTDEILRRLSTHMKTVIILRLQHGIGVCFDACISPPCVRVCVCVRGYGCPFASTIS